MTKKSAYPDNNPKTLLGLTKPSIHAIPASALYWLGRAMADGERKYGLANWRSNKVAASVYFDAKNRHQWAWWDGREDLAPDSLCHHLGHDMACSAILLDAIETGNLIDDRPHPGALPRMLAEWAVKKAEVSSPPLVRPS